MPEPRLWQVPGNLTRHLDGTQTIDPNTQRAVDRGDPGTTQPRYVSADGNVLFDERGERLDSLLHRTGTFTNINDLRELYVGDPGGGQGNQPGVAQVNKGSGNNPKSSGGGGAAPQALSNPPQSTAVAQGLYREGERADYTMYLSPTGRQIAVPKNDNPQTPIYQDERGNQWTSDADKPANAGNVVKVYGPPTVAQSYSGFNFKGTPSSPRSLGPTEGLIAGSAGAPAPSYPEPTKVDWSKQKGSGIVPGTGNSSPALPSRPPLTDSFGRPLQLDSTPGQRISESATALGDSAGQGLSDWSSALGSTLDRGAASVGDYIAQGPANWQEPAPQQPMTPERAFATPEIGASGVYGGTLDTNNNMPYSPPPVPDIGSGAGGGGGGWGGGGYVPPSQANTTWDDYRPQVDQGPAMPPVMAPVQYTPPSQQQLQRAANDTVALDYFMQNPVQPGQDWYANLQARQRGMSPAQGMVFQYTQNPPIPQPYGDGYWRSNGW